MTLRMLKRQPMRSYALVQLIKPPSQDLLQIEKGPLYPALQYLLKEELVKAEASSLQTATFEFYKPTVAGAKHLEREVSSFSEWRKELHEF